MFNLAILVLSLGVFTTNAQQWISPCPSFFTYDPARAQGDTWEGDITLRTDQELSGIWMRVVLDRPPIEVATDFGEVVQRESQEYLVRKPNSKLSPGETQKIRLTVKFNTLEPAPQLVGFRLNARVVCPENGVLDKDQPIVPPPPPVPMLPTLESPCPNEFQYEPLTEPDKWFGVVQVKSETPLNGVWIRIILDRESAQLGVSDEFLQNWFGEVSTGDNKEYVIKNTKFKYTPGTVTPVKFFIKFKPGGPIPKVVEVRINTKTVCQANVVIVPVGQSGVPPLGTFGPVAPATQGSDDDEFFKPDFIPGRKPTLGGEKPTVGGRPMGGPPTMGPFIGGQPISVPPENTFQGDPDFVSEDKILVFQNFYYVIQKYPHFTLIHVKRRQHGQKITIGNFELPFVL